MAILQFLININFVEDHLRALIVKQNILQIHSRNIQAKFPFLKVQL